MSEINPLHHPRFWNRPHPGEYDHTQNSIFSDKVAIPLDMDGVVSKYMMEQFGKMNRRERRKLERDMAKLRLNNKK